MPPKSYSVGRKATRGSDRTEEGHRLAAKGTTCPGAAPKAAIATSGACSRSRLWLIQVQADLCETQSVVVVLPEVILQDAVEQGHASARHDADKVEADTLERGERARHVL